MLQVRLRLHSRNLADFLGRIRDEMKMEQKSHYMYVLECADGSLYTGYAVDVQARLAVHNAGKGAKYTRARLPVSLLAYAEFATKHDAMHAEYVFKQLSRNEKDVLLAIRLPFKFRGGLDKHTHLTSLNGRDLEEAASHIAFVNLVANASSTPKW